MSKAILYTTQSCPYCINAKKILEAKKVDFIEIKIDQDVEKREEMIKLTGRRTVPQIFINNKWIGGFDDLSALNASGQLDKLLKDENHS